MSLIFQQFAMNPSRKRTLDDFDMENNQPKRLAFDFSNLSLNLPSIAEQNITSHYNHYYQPTNHSREVEMKELWKDQYRVVIDDLEKEIEECEKEEQLAQKEFLFPSAPPIIKQPSPPQQPNNQIVLWKPNPFIKEEQIDLMECE